MFITSNTAPKNNKYDAIKVFSLFVVLFFCGYVDASEQKVPFTPMDSLLPMLSGLTVVLVLIFVLAHLFKRFSQFTTSNNQIKVIESLRLGSKEKLMIVKVNEQAFFLGVTPNTISSLGEIGSKMEYSVSSDQAKTLKQTLCQTKAKTPNTKKNQRSAFSHLPSPFRQLFDKQMNQQVALNDSE